jgi:hypothetical protein
LEKTAALPAKLLRNFDSHQAQLEELPDNVFAENTGLIHLPHVRPNLLARETAHGGLKQPLFFTELRERGRVDFGRSRS